MLSPELVRVLACPACSRALHATPSRLVCPNGHCFDLARQGYVHLGTGTSMPRADTPAMVAARARFLGAGHFRPLAERIIELVAPSTDREMRVLEVGAGPAYFLSQVVSAVPGAIGIAVDASRYAARRAARAHPRIGSIVADGLARLPLRAGALSAAVSVLAPRNARELQRVLAPGAPCVVVTPTQRHLRELRGRLSLLQIERGKAGRLIRSFAPWFTLEAWAGVELRLQLGHEGVSDLVAMGPNAFHPSAQRSDALRAVGAQEVTASFVVWQFRRRALTTG